MVQSHCTRVIVAKVVHSGGTVIKWYRVEVACDRVSSCGSCHLLPTYTHHQWPPMVGTSSTDEHRLDCFQPFPTFSWKRKWNTALHWGSAGGEKFDISTAAEEGKQFTGFRTLTDRIAWRLQNNSSECIHHLKAQQNALGQKCCDLLTRKLCLSVCRRRLSTSR